jgi:glycerol-3-phosphate dehydrogenase
VKGSHLVVDKLFDHDRCYIFQNADGRICFAIPYERDFTLIGTTDEDYRGDPGSPHISEGERDYLLGAAGEYFRVPVKRESIRWTYSGVRPLYDDGASRAQEATRDYVLKLDAPESQPPVLSVYGGKITTFRRLAETVMEKLEAFFPELSGAWTAAVALPGGDFAFQDRKRCLDDFARKYAFLPPREAERLFGAYGTRAEMFMGGARSISDMGKKFGAISECEVRYLAEREWAQTAEDVLWRRTKLGLRTSESERAALQNFLKPESEGVQSATSDDKMATGTTGT